MRSTRRPTSSPSSRNIRLARIRTGSRSSASRGSVAAAIDGYLERESTLVIADDVGDDSSDHQSATDKRPGGRNFLEREPYPKRHQRCLKRCDQRGLSRRQQPRSEHKQSQSQRDLEEPEHRKDDQISSGYTGDPAGEGNADDAAQQVRYYGSRPHRRVLVGSDGDRHASDP